MAYIGVSPSNGVRRVHTYTATASQTTFTGASSEGVTLSYADTNYIDVFQNGVLLGSADYTSTSGTSIVLAQGASADDLIVIVVYDVFSVADTVSKTNGGSFDSAVTMSNNLTVSGAFTSQGIDDNADATAITVDSSENVMIGTTSHDGNGMKLQVEHSSSATDGRVQAHGFSCRDNFGSVSNLGNGIASTASNTLVFATNSTEAMRIDSNGNVGIGGNPTNASDHKSLALFGASGTGAGFIEFNDTSGNADGAIFVDNGHLLINADYDNTVASSTIRFRIDGSSEKMRIDSNGKLLVGATTNTTARIVSVADLSSMHTCTFQNSANNTGNIFLRQQNYLGQDCGNITQTGSTTVSYGTSSDYRLKENVVYNFDATTRLKKLKPCRFNFIADGADKVVDGFLAHEVANDADDNAIVPEAIVGQKDAVDDDGNPILQQIDQSKIVPLLVKTIQELEARITALENAE